VYALLKLPQARTMAFFHSASDMNPAVHESYLAWRVFSDGCFKNMLRIIRPPFDQKTPSSKARSIEKFAGLRIASHKHACLSGGDGGGCRDSAGANAPAVCADADGYEVRQSDRPESVGAGDARRDSEDARAPAVHEHVDARAVR
jgi:hypothetical protein